MKRFRIPICQEKHGKNDSILVTIDIDWNQAMSVYAFSVTWGHWKRALVRPTVQEESLNFRVLSTPLTGFLGTRAIPATKQFKKQWSLSELGGLSMLMQLHVILNLPSNKDPFLQPPLNNLKEFTVKQNCKTFFTTHPDPLSTKESKWASTSRNALFNWSIKTPGLRTE